jgi:hypothetical protein
MLLPHHTLQEFQQQQLAVQQHELLDAHQALDAAAASANSVRDALLAVHSALSPHSLAAALGFKADQQGKGSAAAGFSLGAEGYEALTGRLLSAKLVTAVDAEAVAGRVRELLAQVGIRCYLGYLCRHVYGVWGLCLLSW